MSSREVLPVAIEALQCNICFQKDPGLRRARVGLPEPHHVPVGYWSSTPRILILGQNPGAGASRVDGADAHMGSILRRLQGGDLIAWDEYVHHCATDLPKWGSYGRYLKRAGLDPRSVALGNVAMCGLDQDKHFDGRMADECVARHGAQWMHVLRPDIVVLMGAHAKKQRAAIERLAPQATIVESVHYAVGGSLQARLTEDISRLRQIVERLCSATSDSISTMPVQTKVSALARKTSAGDFSDPSATLRLLDELEAMGLPESAFVRIHHATWRERIGTHRRYCEKLASVGGSFSSQTNRDVQRRLKLIRDALVGGGFTNRGVAVFEALANAAVAEVSKKGDST